MTTNQKTCTCKHKPADYPNSKLGHHAKCPCHPNNQAHQVCSADGRTQQVVSQHPTKDAAEAEAARLNNNLRGTAYFGMFFAIKA